MNSSDTRIFLTGSSGFMGRLLIERLLSLHTNTSLLLLQHKKKLTHTESNRVQIVPGDVRDMESLTKAMSGCDIVIHFAATTHAKDREAYSSVNIEGTKNLLEAASLAGVRHFIYISSTAASQNCGAYGESKEKAEEAVRASGASYTIVRFAEVYGVESKEGVERLISVIRRSRVVPYIPGAYLAPVYIDDVLDGLIAVIKRGAENKTYTLSGTKPMLFTEVVAIIAQVFKRKIVAVPIPVFLMRILAQFPGLLSAPDQVARLMCVKDYDTELAKKDLGYTPRTFEEGLQQGYF